MTQEELATLCAEWQNRLGLAHWTVEAAIVRHFRVTDGRAGEVTFSRPRMFATIRILHHDDIAPESVGPEDYEHTLVHELLHLPWAVVQPDNDTEEHVGFEQAINLTARALVKLKREKETTA